MALPNRLGTYVFEYDGGSIKLCATFPATEALEADVEQHWMPYLGTAGLDVVNRLTTIFYHFQIESAYTKDEIYAWLAADILEWQKPEMKEKIEKCMATLVGKKFLEQFPAPSGDKKKDQN